MKNRQQGFTLIDLMIVLAIICILTAMAMPTYQDYIIRTQVSEGLALSAGAKSAVSEYYMDLGAWPADNNQAGLADMHDIIGKYTEHMSVNDNVIEIKFGYDAHTQIFDQKIELTAVNNAGSISWACASAGVIAPKHLPDACR
jgi:type IV pilus assembly protein PilA